MPSVIEPLPVDLASMAGHQNSGIEIATRCRTFVPHCRRCPNRDVESFDAPARFARVRCPRAAAMPTCGTGAGTAPRDAGRERPYIAVRTAEAGLTVAHLAGA